MTAWFQFIGGLVALLGGAEIFVRGCVNLALRLKMSPTTVGLTIVALGTSLPELVVGVEANLAGKAELATSSMLGSNIFNIGCVLAITAMIYPVSIQSRTVRLEYPFMLGSVVLLWWLLADGKEPYVLGQLDGALLLGSSLLFVLFLVLRTRLFASRRRLKEVEETLQDAEMPTTPIIAVIAMVLAGPVLLKLGGDLTLEGASAIAKSWGWSEYVIGLTVIAFATSAPELAVSSVAAFRKNTEVAIGNVIGSCIFNLGMVLGVASLIRPLPVESRVIEQDIWWVAAFTVLVLPLMLQGKKLGRIDGAVLFLLFITYYALLLLF